MAILPRHRQSGAVLITALFLFTLIFTLSAFAAEATAPEENKEDFFKRERGEEVWERLVPDVDFVASEGFYFKYGDTIVTRELPLVVEFGENNLLIFPYAVVRVHGWNDDKTEMTNPIPELMFGEAIFYGSSGTVFIPGFSVECSTRVSLEVYDDKTSDIAAIIDDQILVPLALQVAPEGAAPPEPVKTTVPGGTYTSVADDGEMGYIDPIMPEILADYIDMELEDEEIRARILKDAEVYLLQILNEFWNGDRISMLVRGEETPEGKEIAAGGALEEEPEITSVIQVNQGGGKIEQKSISFGGQTVAVEESAGEYPQLGEVKIGGIKANPEDTLNLEFKHLDDKNLTIAGKTVTAKEDFWNIFVKINDDEYLADGVKSFSYNHRVIQDFANPPSVFGITIGDRSSDVYMEEYAMVTRDYLDGGKLVVGGSAEPGENVLNYNIELIARDKKETRESSLAKYTVQLDLTELSRVEVSIDDGIGWEEADGTTDWTYSLRPNDGDDYRVKVFAYDVMDNQSEEQFESFSFEYSYKTSSELVQTAFEEQIRALLDKDRSTFLNNVSQDFSSDLKDLRDIAELESSIETRFRVGEIDIKYSVSDVDAYLDTGQGYVDFVWSGGSGVSGQTFSALFNYVYEEGEWVLQEVIDENTFLRLSHTVEIIQMRSDDDLLIADGENTTTVYADCYDKSGTIVADDIPVEFFTNMGSVSPVTAYTYEGVAETTFTVSDTPGTATISASAETENGDTVTETIEITLDPIISTIVLTAVNDTLTADGEETTEITATCSDGSGSAVADGVAVEFFVDSGSVSPSIGYTSGGIVQTTYTAPTAEGTATITAQAVELDDINESINITLNPIAAPLPPDEE